MVCGKSGAWLVNEITMYEFNEAGLTSGWLFMHLEHGPRMMFSFHRTLFCYQNGFCMFKILIAFYFLFFLDLSASWVCPIRCWGTFVAPFCLINNIIFGRIINYILKSDGHGK